MSLTTPERAESSDSPTIIASVRITEIFRSIQGESTRAGLSTVFVRLTGCPLRCQYCDTAYAFSGGQRHEITEIVKRVNALETLHVCVTGGEPLAQPGALDLLTALADQGLSVSLETSGALNIGDVDSRVSRIMDLKTPGSGESARNRYENVELLRSDDEVKFVICSRDDFDWAVKTVQKYRLNDRCTVLFSPSASEIKGVELADWILQEKVQVRMQLQMHKLLWGDSPGR